MNEDDNFLYDVIFAKREGHPVMDADLDKYNRLHKKQYVAPKIPGTTPADRPFLCCSTERGRQYFHQLNAQGQ